MAMFFLPIITVALNFVFTILTKGVEDQKGRQLIVNRVFRESFTLRFTSKIFQRGNCLIDLWIGSLNGTERFSE